MPDLLPSSVKSAPSVDTWSPESIRDHLLAKLDLNFGRIPGLAFPLAGYRNDWLVRDIVRIHFQLPLQAAHDCVLASRTVQELTHRLADLLCPGLFTPNAERSTSDDQRPSLPSVPSVVSEI